VNGVIGDTGQQAGQGVKGGDLRRHPGETLQAGGIGDENLGLRRVENLLNPGAMPRIQGNVGCASLPNPEQGRHHFARAFDKRTDEDARTDSLSLKNPSKLIRASLQFGVGERAVPTLDCGSFRSFSPRVRQQFVRRQLCQYVHSPVPDVSIAKSVRWAKSHPCVVTQTKLGVTPVSGSPPMRVKSVRY
jgi:hypothetical protein